MYARPHTLEEGIVLRLAHTPRSTNGSRQARRKVRPSWSWLTSRDFPNRKDTDWRDWRDWQSRQSKQSRQSRHDFHYYIA
jgi:hypothetical protein